MNHGTGFVAAILEGFESTIEELQEGTRESPRVAAGLDVLKSQVASLRLSLEAKPDSAVEPDGGTASGVIESRAN